MTTMKKLILILLCCMTFTQIQAQDVFRELLANAKSVAEDTSRDIETRKIATFKYDELSYMAMKVRDDVLRDTTNLTFFNQTVKMLNEQAFAMHEFVQLYVKQLAAAKKPETREVVMTLFRDASLMHPLFNDMDKELVLAYCQNDKYITQFSLDTDWIKALEVVRKREQ